MTNTQTQIKIKYEALRSIDSATFTGSYQAVGTPLTHAARKVKFKNLSNQIVTISTDGTNDMDVFQANSGDSDDISANSNGGYIEAVMFPVGTQFYVKGSAGTGSFYIVVQYT